MVHPHRAHLEIDGASIDHAEHCPYSNDRGPLFRGGRIHHACFLARTSQEEGLAPAVTSSKSGGKPLFLTCSIAGVAVIIQPNLCSDIPCSSRCSEPLRGRSIPQNTANYMEYQSKGWVDIP